MTRRRCGSGFIPGSRHVTNGICFVRSRNRYDLDHHAEGAVAGFPRRNASRRVSQCATGRHLPDRRRGADHLFQRGGCHDVGSPPEAQCRSVVRLVAAVLARRHADAARCMPHGDHLERTPRGSRRPGNCRAPGRQPRAVHGISDTAARCLRRLRRRRQHAHRHERAAARRAGIASPRRDHRIVR
jgi:hypothetical protein